MKEITVEWRKVDNGTKEEYARRAKEKRDGNDAALIPFYERHPELRMPKALKQ